MKFNFIKQAVPLPCLEFIDSQTPVDVSSALYGDINIDMVVGLALLTTHIMCIHSSTFLLGAEALDCAATWSFGCTWT